MTTDQIATCGGCGCELDVPAGVLAIDPCVCGVLQWTFHPDERSAVPTDEGMDPYIDETDFHRGWLHGRDATELACIRAVCPNYCGEGHMPRLRMFGVWNHGMSLCNSSPLYELRHKREAKRDGD